MGGERGGATKVFFTLQIAQKCRKFFKNQPLTTRGCIRVWGAARESVSVDRMPDARCQNLPGFRFHWLHSSPFFCCALYNTRVKSEGDAPRQFFWRAAVCGAPAAAPNERGNALVLLRCCGWSRRHSRAPGQKCRDARAFHRKQRGTISLLDFQRRKLIVIS